MIIADSALPALGLALAGLNALLLALALWLLGRVWRRCLNWDFRLTEWQNLRPTLRPLALAAGLIGTAALANLAFRVHYEQSALALFLRSWGLEP